MTILCFTSSLGKKKKKIKINRQLTIEFSIVEATGDFDKGSFDGMAEKRPDWSFEWSE